MRNLPESRRHAPVNSVIRDSQYDRLNAVHHGKGEYAPHGALCVGAGQDGIKRSATIRSPGRIAQTGPCRRQREPVPRQPPRSTSRDLPTTPPRQMFPTGRTGLRPLGNGPRPRTAAPARPACHDSPATAPARTSARALALAPAPRHAAEPLRSGCSAHRTPHAATGGPGGHRRNRPSAIPAVPSRPVPPGPDRFKAGPHRVMPVPTGSGRFRTVQAGSGRFRPGPRLPVPARAGPAAGPAAHGPRTTVPESARGTSSAPGSSGSAPARSSGWVSAAPGASASV